MTQDEPRIGVFVCHCGVNIGGFLDVPDVAECAKTLPNVVHAENNLYTCADDGLTAIQNAIKEHNLNRVIVASCTPRTHAPLFMRICEEAGLNKYLFTFVNIREHCSWVHMKEQERATEKAKDLIRMGVARAVLLTPQEEIKTEVRPSSLVIGGGIAGMTAALSLANQGFETHLIEKEAELGGFLRNLDTLYQTGEASTKAFEPLIEKVKSNKKIILHTNTTLKSLKGYIGKYDAVLDVNGEDKDIGVGTIIIATGAEEYRPKLYGLDEYDNVITLTDFEKLSREGRLPSELKNVAFITCSGARGQDKEYCSRICCTVTVKDAMKVMEMASKGEEPQAEEKPGEAQPGEAVEEEEPAEEEGRGSRRRSTRDRRARRGARRRGADRGAERGAERPRERGGVEVTVFNRGITTYGVEQELLYNKAREKRVKFVRYVPENPPKVTMEDGKLTVSYYHETLKADRTMQPDLVVLATPLARREDAEALSKMCKVPLGRDEFFLEAHVKLRPVDFATDGIFLCGTAHGPANIHEAVAQAYGAASRASIPMSRGFVQAEAIVSHVDRERCSGCRSCERVCPYGAIQFDEEGIAVVVVAACKGCGTCGSICPEKAINMTHYTDEQLTAEAIAALEEVGM
ncbi:MAG: CoB--CoM heterodisulfide reductase iron-sulfur subunit A family protein [Thermoplasmata archaeon]|nr:MAG: CoB--CoM heterodisulfide reductase iron-sulfur subunit A family protein [Thermoplasmata archaeon]